MRKHLTLGLVLAAYFVAGGLFAALTPPWQAPDEPAHYNYVRQLAEGRLPVIEARDYDQAYQARVIASRFDPRYSVATFTYEDWQPPLYYLLLAPAFLLSRGSLVVLRLASVLIGAGVVWLSFLVARQVLREEQKWLAVTIAAFVALLPQHVAILASVNNDALAELIILALLYLLVSWLRFANPGARSQDRRLLAMGLLLGLGFLTKGTVYLMAPVVIGAAAWYFWPQRQGLLRVGLLIALPAGLLGAVWWLRNIAVYGGLDVMGIAAHDAVVVGQPLTSQWLAELGPAEFSRRFLVTSFRSFWGQFGWMAAPFPDWVYWPLLLFSGLSLAGLLLAIWRRPGAGRATQAGRPADAQAERTRLIGGALTALAGLTVLLYLSYNVRYVQHQGRYLFPALLPIAFAVALGWEALLQPVLQRRFGWRYGLPAGLTAGLLALCLLGLFFTILPHLRP